MASLTFRIFEEEATDNAHVDDTLHAYAQLCPTSSTVRALIRDVFPRSLLNGRPRDADVYVFASHLKNTIRERLHVCPARTHDCRHNAACVAGR